MGYGCCSDDKRSSNTFPTSEPPNCWRIRETERPSDRSRRSRMPTPVANSHVASDVARQGFAIAHEALNPHEIDTLLTAGQGLSDAVKETGRGGARAFFERVPEIRTLARHKSVRGAATAALGSNCFPVRALLFDKTPAANWKVTWHQDLTIAVRARRDVEGYGPWSSKAGIPHVQPPISVLEGGLVVMRPLLLHASSPAKSPGHRRVVHIEYAAAELADGLKWYEAPHQAFTDS